jgi:beta-lactamase class C
MVTSCTRWWRCRRPIGLVIFPVLLLALARGSVADIGMDAKVQHIVTAALAPETVGKAGGLAVAVHTAGHTQFFNYGFADQLTKRPITSDTLFNVASVRKLFDASLVALGTLRGELSLDDPVSRYIPELRGDYIRSVTIGELATHTSGLSLPTDHPPWPDHSFTLQQFFDALNAWTPQSGEQPGKQRIYTHAGYVLLQLALERRYGRPIGELIEDRILKPLGMNQTFLPERGPDNRAIMGPELLKRVVQGYSDTGMAIGAPGNQQGYYDFPGTGQMFSSTRDLATFLAALIDGEAIDPQLRQALQMTQREAFRVTEKFGQAMAWENVHLNDGVVVDKPGGLNNATAYVGLVPAHKAGIVLLANRGDFPHEIARYRVLPELARERVLRD